MAEKETKDRKNRKQLSRCYFNLTVSLLNINNLLVPIKIQKLSNEMKKQDPTLSCLQEIHFKNKGISWLKEN